MLSSQYTSDAICRSMGLPGFIEANWSLPTLRLLLKPSFDPEVCITFRSDARLQVVALTERLWAQPGPCLLNTCQEEAAISVNALAGQEVRFRVALAAIESEARRSVSIDGMPVASCLLTENGLEQFACSPSRQEVTDFVNGVVQLAWEECRQPRIRNALAECGKYLGLQLTHQPEPPDPFVTRIGVLGTPDSRAELIAQLPKDVATNVHNPRSAKLV